MDQPAWTLEDITEALRGYDPTVFPRWYNTLNTWRWPEDCPVPCPLILQHARLAQQQHTDAIAGWKAFRAVLGVEEHRQLIRPLMHYLQQHTTPAEISCYWWLHHLHRTEEEWEAWWQEEADSEARLHDLHQWDEA